MPNFEHQLGLIVAIAKVLPSNRECFKSPRTQRTIRITICQRIPGVERVISCVAGEYFLVGDDAIFGSSSFLQNFEIRIRYLPTAQRPLWVQIVTCDL